MDAPPIRYARTDDGMDIGYAMVGAGRPTVIAERVLNAGVDISLRPGPFLEEYAPLAAGRSLVFFDWRGLGTSAEADDYSPETFERDLAAVVEAVAAPQVDLIGIAALGNVAASYASRNPERVRRLAWPSSSGSGGSGRTDPRFEPIMSIVHENWPAFAELFALLAYGWDNIESGRSLHARLIQRFKPDLFDTLMTAVESLDAMDGAPRLTMPCLLHSVDALTSVQLRSVRKFVSELPNGRHIVTESRDNRANSNPRDWVEIVAAFFDEGQESKNGVDSGFRTVMFTDLAASTALTQRLGDAAAQDLVRAHNDIVRPAVAAHDGHEIKHTGDGIMAWFPAASNGLDCAQVIQQGVTDLANPDLGVKIGLNAGEPIAEEDDLYGTAVQIAARVTDQAHAGEIVCTNVVRELVAGKPYLFSEREPAALKGVEEPVRLFEVSWRS